MDFRDTGSFADFTKQRELLLSGQFNTLFNELSFNLPHRFLAYAKPESTDNLFQKLFQNLDNSKIKINKNDAWAFDKVIKIISPNENYENFANSIKFLINTCQIPEKHIFLNKDSDKDAFHWEQIYLSRYAMCLLTNNLLQESKSFKNDLSAQLFLSSAEKSREKEKNDFEQEMRTAFAGYYFAHPDTDYEELSEVTWIWVRGKRLKLAYDSAIRDLEYLFRGIHGKKFTYHKFEEFKQNFIFDILFKQTGNMTFKKQYETALKSFGYKLGSLDEYDIKWHKGHKVAPKYPGGFFAPHIAFLLTWTINQFCQFEQHEFDCKTKDRVTWLENLAKNFFAAVKEGLFTEKIKHNKTEYDFSQSPTFVEQHHSEANRIVNSIKNGSGPKTLDKQIGEKIHENPGALEFWKHHNLFCEDEICCLNVRKYAENKLKELHKEYKEKPSTKLARQIGEQEEIIRKESRNLYGVNFQYFVDVPETIGLDGKFLSRPMFGPDRVVNDFYTPKSITTNEVQRTEKDPLAGQYKIDFDNQNVYEINTNLLNPIELPDFQILPDNEITIPHGIPFAEKFYTGCKKDKKTGKKIWVVNQRYFEFDKNGNRESTNPLVANPPILNKKGYPTNADANFEMQSMVIECDHLSIEDQIKQAKRLIGKNLPNPNEITLSGGKSVHIKFTFKHIPKTREEYKWLYWYIIEKYKIKDADPACCHNGRLKRRSGAKRLFPNGVEKVQELLHRTNGTFDLDWQPLYNAHKIKIQQEYELRKKEILKYNQTEYQQFYAKQVFFLLGGWIKDNRYNTLMKGIVPKMVKAGFNEQEIWNKLPIEDCDNDLKRIISDFTENAFAKYDLNKVYNPQEKQYA